MMQVYVDGDYVVGGKSNSGIGGDKTENNNGDFDFWLVKMTTCEATTEVCNTLDDDCDGLIDEGVKSIFYGDSDGDGFGVPEITILACSAPEGYADIIGDCYDANPAIYPGATEICNGVDDNYADR
ncbi:MAG: putative metal-binding motif-containing protein [Bacteroidetes bacterium]|nr:putative metal-binding motif-containing protein [Bacteroidota bacterium]